MGHICNCVHVFYAFEFPIFYSHHNHENNIIIVPSILGTHQYGPLGTTLFALTHFRALCFTINHFPSYLFHLLQKTFTSYPTPFKIVSFAYVSILKPNSM